MKEKIEKLEVEFLEIKDDLVFAWRNYEYAVNEINKRSKSNLKISKGLEDVFRIAMAYRTELIEKYNKFLKELDNVFKDLEDGEMKKLLVEAYKKKFEIVLEKKGDYEL